MKQVIPMSEQDFDYFKKIVDTLKELENRITALEITKLNIFEEYKEVKKVYTQFSQQIKDKYNLPVDEVEIDEEGKNLIYDDGQEEKMVDKKNKKK